MTLTFISPAVMFDEMLTFELTVNDGNDDSNVVIEVLVKQINQRPMVSIDNHESHYIEEKVVTLTIQSTDADEDDLTYLWEQVSGPSISFDNATAKQVSIVLPEITFDEAIELQVTVSDGELTSVATTSFTVTDVTEVISVIPVKESSGGSMAWLLIVILLVSVKRTYLLAKVA